MPKRELVGRVRDKSTEPKKPKKPRKKPDRPVCGAKRSNNRGFCQSTVVFKNGRCRLHGGTNKGPKKQKVKKERQRDSVVHGIYAHNYYLEGETQAYAEVLTKIGSLDEEINLNRMMLRRVSSYQSKLDAARMDLLEVANDKEEFIRVALAHKLLTVKEIEDQEGQVPIGDREGRYLTEIAKSRMIRKVENFNSEIRKYTQTIKRLEQARKEFLETEDWGEDFVRKLAEDLRKFSSNADSTVPMGLGSGNYPGLNATCVTQ